MSIKNPIKMLDNMDTGLIQKQGWRLARMFADEVENSYETYQEAVDYAKVLSTQFNVAIRSVTHNNSHFLEVYRK